MPGAALELRRRHIAQQVHAKFQRGEVPVAGREMGRDLGFAEARTTHGLVRHIDAEQPGGVVGMARGAVGDR